jgi:hypothetical protein
MFVRLTNFFVGPLLLSCVAWSLLGCHKPELVKITSQDDTRDANNSGMSGSASAQASLPPADPPLAKAGRWIAEEQLPWNTWYVQYLRGERIGYFHVAVEQGTIGLVKIRRRTMVELMADDAPRRFEVTLESFESADGSLRSVKEVTTGEGATRTVVGNNVGGKLTLTTEEGDQKEQLILNWEDGTWGVLGIQSVFMCKPMQAGESRRARIFLSNSQSIETIDLVAGEAELTLLPGGASSQLLPVTVSSVDGMHVARHKVWLDQHGLVRKSVTLEGPKINTFQVSAVVGEIVADEYQLKTLLNVSLPCAGQLPSPRATRVTYEAQTSSQAMYDFWAQGGRQSFRSKSALDFEITVHRLHAATTVDQAPPTAQCLSASALIQPQHPLIQAMAERLAQGAQTADEVIDRLTKGVHDEMRDTPFSEKVLGSVDAAQLLAGDCTEHAMLLVALLRSRGIPARVACGLRLDPQKRRFTYHMWTEAWSSASWRSVDASLGDVASSGCIKMFDSAVADPNPFALILPVLDKMQLLEMRVIDSEVSGNSEDVNKAGC